MLKSMTGFGRGESFYRNKNFSIEIKSVNHRYLDISIKLPKKFTYMEESIRNIVKAYVQRGRVDIFISYENLGDSEVRAKVDVGLAKEYLNALEEIHQQLGVQKDITVSLLAKFPDIITLEKKEDDEDEIWKSLEEGITKAMDKLMDMRRVEGQKLKEDLLKRLEKIGDFTEAIQERSPTIVTEYRQRLQERVKEMMDEKLMIEDHRIAMEVALFADKSSITEEIVRLHSHIEQFTKSLQEEEAVGRKLDFLIQEMNREINTIGSKANDLIITNIVVNVKSELEKMREQVQNIE